MSINVEPGMAAPQTRTILYLHGFLSSPASSKVSALADGIAAWNAGADKAGPDRANIRFELAAPDLNVPPPLAAAYLRALGATYDPASLTIVGSSLGGFYAGRLANMTGARVVLLNPCLNPWAFVQTETGDRQIYATERRIKVEPRFSADFEALSAAVPPVPKNLKNTLAVLSTADEVLDWRLAWGALQGAGIIFSAGDDHRVSRFPRYVPALLKFAAAH